MFYFYRERHCLWGGFFWKEMRFSQYIFCKNCVFRCSMDADSLTINNKLPISNILPCQISLGKSKKSVFVRENDSLPMLFPKRDTCTRPRCKDTIDVNPA